MININKFGDCAGTGLGGWPTVVYVFFLEGGDCTWVKRGRFGMFYVSQTLVETSTCTKKRKNAKWAMMCFLVFGSCRLIWSRLYAFPARFWGHCLQALVFFY